MLILTFVTLVFHSCCASQAYAAQMGHASGTTSFRCQAPRRPCLASGNVSVAVHTQTFSAAWYPSPILNGPGNTQCAVHSDCDDSDACTVDTCIAGCCAHVTNTSLAQCITHAEGFKANRPMLNYIARVTSNASDSRPVAWTGFPSSVVGLSLR